VQERKIAEEKVQEGKSAGGKTAEVLQNLT